MRRVFLPIKDSNVLKKVQDTLLDSFKVGRRNYTFFQVGKATLLRVSDVMQPKDTDIFTLEGVVEQKTLIYYKKTGKTNTLHLKLIHNRIYCLTGNG